MEHENIHSWTTTEGLLNQYIEVAFTSKSFEDISPIPERYSALLVYPRYNRAVTLEFAEFYQHKVLHNFNEVHQWKTLLNTTTDLPLFLLHPLSSSLVFRTGEGVTCVQVLPNHVDELEDFLRQKDAVFEAGGLAKGIERKHPRLVPTKILPLQKREVENDK